MKNIIIPVDFSVYSEFALKTAAKLALKYKASLILIHMLEMPTGYATQNTANNQAIVFMLKLAEKKMHDFLNKKYLNNIDIKVLVKHYTLFPDIGTIAKEYDSSLIVMGSHGENHNNGPFLGSNTEKVIRNSKTPVLVVKDEIPNIDFEKAIYVSNFKLDTVDAYRRAQKFFSEINIRPKLLFINTPDSGFVSTAEMDNRFKDFLLRADGHLNNLDCFENYDDYNVLNGVKYYAKKHKCNLISIATHGKSTISKFFNQSVSLNLAEKSQRPVITFLI